MVKYNCQSQYILRQLAPVLFKKQQPPMGVKEKRFRWHSTTYTDISFTVFKKIDLIYDFWQANVSNNNLLLDYAYLKNLEDHPFEQYQPYYFLIRKHGHIVGLAYAQVIDVSLLDALQWDDENSFSNRLKKWFAGKMSFNIFVCGNQMFTGEHGFTFDESQINRETFLGALCDSMEYYAHRVLPQNIHLLCLKDLDIDSKVLPSKGFFIDSFLPNMSFCIPEDCDTMDDYMDALSSKYRVRAKRAFKKAKNVVFLELTALQIKAFQEQMMQLYKAVVSNAAFNVVHAPDTYFLDFKRSFPEEFRVFGCFENQKLIGFYTSFKNGKDLEAHYLGIDLEKNRKYQLYLNILYKLIEVGIEEDVEKIIFGRTSMAIKSSVGAKAVQPFNYIKHSNRIMNRLLPSILQYFSPEENWELRHPFKTASVSDNQNEEWCNS